MISLAALCLAHPRATVTLMSLVGLLHQQWYSTGLLRILSTHEESATSASSTRLLFQIATADRIPHVRRLLRSLLRGRTLLKYTSKTAASRPTGFQGPRDADNALVGVPHHVLYDRSFRPETDEARHGSRHHYLRQYLCRQKKLGCYRRHQKLGSALLQTVRRGLLAVPQLAAFKPSSSGPVGQPGAPEDGLQCRHYIYPTPS